MERSATSTGRKLAFVLAIIAIVLGLSAVVVDLARGREFNPRPLGAVVVGAIVLASLQRKTHLA